MTHFSHSDIIPSFGDEDEWDDVDHFPYRESTPEVDLGRWEGGKCVRSRGNEQCAVKRVK